MSGRRKPAGREAVRADIATAVAESALRGAARNYAEACDLDGDPEYGDAGEEEAWRELRDAALAYAKLVQR